MTKTKVADCREHAALAFPGSARSSASEPLDEDRAVAVARQFTASRYPGRLALRVIEFSSPERMTDRTPTTSDQYCERERALDAVSNSEDAVLVVPPYAERPIRRVVVAVDFSHASVRAAIAALEMTGHHGRVSLVHVASATRHVGGRLRADVAAEPRDSTLFGRFVALLHVAATVHLDTVTLSGDSVGALLRYAEEQEVDLIACGVRRRAPDERASVGRVPTSLIRGAPCSVLVVPDDRP